MLIRLGLALPVDVGSRKGALPDLRQPAPRSISACFHSCRFAQAGNSGFASEPHADS
jgi:hypothetical protein